jgi:hypothetical protein
MDHTALGRQTPLLECGPAALLVCPDSRAAIIAPPLAEVRQSQVAHPGAME